GYNNNRRRRRSKTTTTTTTRFSTPQPSNGRAVGVKEPDLVEHGQSSSRLRASATCSHRGATRHFPTASAARGDASRTRRRSLPASRTAAPGRPRKARTD
ncbi:unnamed protein product, partial [Ectocarpus fasciculatus]